MKNEIEMDQIILSVNDLSFKTKSFRILAHIDGIVSEESTAYDVAESEFSFSKEDAGKYFRVGLLLLKSGGVGFLVLKGIQSAKDRSKSDKNDYEIIGFIVSGRISDDGTKLDFYQRISIAKNYFISKSEQLESEKKLGLKKDNSKVKSDEPVQDEPVQDVTNYIKVEPQIQIIEVPPHIITPTLDSMKNKKWGDLDRSERDFLIKTFAEQSGLIQK